MEISELVLLRVRDVMKLSGLPRSTLYRRIELGLYPGGTKYAGSKTVTWLKHEAELINAATIAEEPEENVKALVIEMKLARPKIFESLKARIQFAA